MTDTILWLGIGVLVSLVFWSFMQALRNKEIFEALLNSLKEPGIRNKAEKYLEAIDVVMEFTFPKANKAYKTYSVLLNFKLYSALVPFVIEMLRADPASRQAKTVVGIMIGEKIRQASKAQLWLILAMALSLISDIWLQLGTGAWGVMVCGVSLFAIQIDQKLLEYRVKQGLYGSNAFETLEIINFIISHSNKDDFDDQGGLKRIIPEPEFLNENTKVPVLGGAYS